MGRIFLSYAREDRAFAAMAAALLERAGHSVWWDRRLEGGEEFSSEIEAALGEADVVVVAWSAESVKSRWVRDEASVGGDSGRLVPVSVDGSLPPMGFRQFHTLDLSGWRGGSGVAREPGSSPDFLHYSCGRRADAPRPAFRPARRACGAGRILAERPASRFLQAATSGTGVRTIA